MRGFSTQFFIKFVNSYILPFLYNCSSFLQITSFNDIQEHNVKSRLISALYRIKKCPPFWDIIQETFVKKFYQVHNYLFRILLKYCSKIKKLLFTYYWCINSMCSFPFADMATINRTRLLLSVNWHTKCQFTYTMMTKSSSKS